MTEQDNNIATRIKNRERMIDLVEKDIKRSENWLKVWDEKLIEANESGVKEAIELVKRRIEAEKNYLKNSINFKNQLLKGLEEDKKMNKVNE